MVLVLTVVIVVAGVCRVAGGCVGGSGGHRDCGGVGAGVGAVFVVVVVVDHQQLSAV